MTQRERDVPCDATHPDFQGQPLICVLPSSHRGNHVDGPRLISWWSSAMQFSWWKHAERKRARAGSPFPPPKEKLVFEASPLTLVEGGLSAKKA